MANVSKETLDSLPASILGRAIQKAIDGGWDDFDTTEWWKVYYAYGDRLMVEFRPAQDAMGMFYSYKDIIYSNDFAKALWGDGKEVEVPEIGGGTYTHFLWNELGTVLPRYAYQWHLQQMVISDNPIQYIADNLK